MTRPVPSGLAAALQGNPLAGECLVLLARDGTEAGFTTLVRAQSIDLTADGGPGPVACTHGMVLSAITLAAGLEASFAEVQGPLGDALTQDAIDGGKWSDAEAWLVRVSPGETGYAPLLYGRVRESRAPHPRWVLEIRNQADALNQPLEKLISPYCDAEFGDARCGFVVTPVAAVVTAATDAMRFSVSYSGTYADDFFNLGRVTFTSGALAGVTSAILFDFTSGGAGAGALVLDEPLPAAPQVGDALDLREGCALTRPACLLRDNVVNFRGFPDVPGTDQVLKYPNPGA